MSVVRDSFSSVILWYLLVVHSGGKHQLKKNTKFKKIKILFHLLSASLDPWWLQKAQLHFLHSVMESVCCLLFLFDCYIELLGFLLGFTEDARKNKNYFMKKFSWFLETSCSSLPVVTGLSPTTQPSVDLWGYSVHLWFVRRALCCFCPGSGHP